MMEAKQKALLKHFSSVLRKKALNESSINEPIDPVILRFLSRKELIEIIKNKFENSIPKDLQLLELENEELLAIIGDEMYIISYITSNWVQVAQTEKEVVPITKKSNTKKNEKTTPISKQTKSS
ncbi:hypothetical protein SAMN05444411_102248 [Lutibacter oricola]|uniref:Uncharacterized protein n=1 Tax=Lutibacter oricola TaxID=762486 RepID=A0A1H2WNT3_9FLAO|nr:hypothetical protein [Lutibacter oricola]SDW82292.1 hypothetical protein SAMN05444411_102248 [Lutibacter oricola]